MNSHAVAVILCASLAAAAGAQQALFSNSGGAVTDPGLITGSVTASGQAAPQGAMWSELQGDSTGAFDAVAGFAGHVSGGSGAYRFADDFVVPADSWTLTRASVYAYQTGAPGASFSGVTARIWFGRPGDPQSFVVWGNTTTNRLLQETPTNIYRVFNTVASPVPPAPDTTRMIWKLDVDLSGASLGPGVYWLDWQVQASDAGFEAFSPAVTVPGARAKAGANARQFKPGAGGASGTWSDVVDPGKPLSAADVSQDLPFILVGYAGTVPCPADINGDGYVNGDDFDVFSVAFFYGDLLADFDHNGFVTGEDFDAFMIAFQGGC